MKFTETHVRGLFLLAGIEIRTLFQIDNCYWPDSYVDLRRESPWFIVTTAHGAIKIGWRKRVLSIDWRDTPLRKIITEDQTTKEEDMVHAWTYLKALEYLTAVGIALDDLARAKAARVTIEAPAEGVLRG